MPANTGRELMRRMAERGYTISVDIDDGEAPESFGASYAKAWELVDGVDVSNVLFDKPGEEREWAGLIPCNGPEEIIVDYGTGGAVDDIWESMFNAGMMG